MNITTDIIAKHLSENYVISSNDSPKKATLCSFRFYDKKNIEPNILYIMRPSDFAYLDISQSENAYLVAGVVQNLKELSDGNRSAADVIYIKNDVDLSILTNRLCDIFDLYNEWERKLDKCPANMEGLQEMIDISGDILDGSVIMADYRFNYVAFSREWAGEINLIKNAWHGQTPDYIVEDLLTNPDYIRLQNSREIFEYPIHRHDRLVNAYCCNLFRPREEEYRVRILYVPKSYPAKSSSLYLLKFFAEKMTRIYNEIPDTSLPFSSYHELRSAIRNGIEKEPYSRGILNSTLRYIGWDIKDTYQLLTFTPYFFEDTKEINGVTQLQLEIMIPYSCTVIYEKSIVAVINLTKAGFSKAGIDTSLIAGFIRDHLYKVGASVPFDDFGRLDQAYLEAKTALAQGNRKDSSFWFYSFGSYSFSYIIEHCQSEISSRDLCHPRIRSFA